jgi:hypothetical protein
MRRPRAHVATPGRFVQGHHLPDRGQAATSPTSRRRSVAHNVRERGTGERRDEGAGTAAARPSQAAWQMAANVTTPTDGRARRISAPSSPSCPGPAARSSGHQ